MGGDQLIGIYKRADPPPIVEEKSQAKRGVEDHVYLSKVEELTAAFEFADAQEIFEGMIEGESQDNVETAIALAPSIPIRQLLRGFYETVYGQLDYLWGNIAARVANAAQGLPG